MSLAAGLAGAVLRGHEPDIGHQLPGPFKTVKVADLDRQPDGGQRVDPTQAPQPRDRLRARRIGNELRDRGLQGAAAQLERLDRADIVSQRRLRPWLAEIDLGEPPAVALTPGGCQFFRVS